MSCKVARVALIFNNLYRSYASAHHTALTSDIYSGTSISKKKYDSRKLPPSTYGGRKLITMLPGDDPGPKLMEYVQDIFYLARVPLDFEIIPVAKQKTEENINSFNQMAILSMKRNRVGIKGNIPKPIQQDLQVSSNVTIRTTLDLYVCVVHCRSYEGVPCRYPCLDMYIVRQNTEGEYSMLEHESKPGIVESLKVITEENTERLARWTFEFARRENRKKVTIVHKANIMKLSDGLFMKTVKQVAKDYPEIKVDDMIVDNCTMQLVSHPETFDIIITPNLYGNILSNIVCGLIGGPGLMAGENYGNDYALFEAASRHLSYDVGDKEAIVNPVCMLNAAVDLLFYLGKTEHAKVIDQAITKTLDVDQIHTEDIGGCNSADDVVECIKENIREAMETNHLKLF